MPKQLKNSLFVFALMTICIMICVAVVVFTVLQPGIAPEIVAVIASMSTAVSQALIRNISEMLGVTEEKEDPLKIVALKLLENDKETIEIKEGKINIIRGNKEIVVEPEGIKE